MHDPSFMRVFESVDDLVENGKRFFERHGALRDAIGERWALHQFKDQSRAFQAVNRRDIRMIERGDQFCFALEASQTVRIASDAVGQNLQRNLPLQAAITGPVDFAHAPRAKRRQHFVGSNEVSGSQHVSIVN